MPGAAQNKQRVGFVIFGDVDMEEMIRRTEGLYPSNRTLRTEVNTRRAQGGHGLGPGVSAPSGSRHRWQQGLERGDGNAEFRLHEVKMAEKP